ncbi:heptaprenylglyceryl phosphate synthase [Jeotgalibacillus haloalkalitolerans]|uniref:Heptaprenylglyceryl phosphate synthase n=1 Tax=Jeotgalibacillus haloalkalitolerans TaxID=3104292 RepID=A0ABU5KQI1_9BACL|nr:heptaprenylglyceryl phosphate synthase [Jeotgalibacillus sp. HH7-29]MDZ5713494.1 heptaprenylglyceryl phosphate synthase [Jeotgalibacillus sp. HH7-29]
MYDVREWKHVFKLDPNKEITDEALEKICESGTDAVMVGGSDGVTLENVLDLMARVRRYTVPCVLEVSALEAITPGYDLYFIPTVLNTEDPKWFKGIHHEAVKEHGDLMNWEEILAEGYCILNPDCKAASLTGADATISDDEVIAYARMAEHLFSLPVFYMEYSGTYGDPSLVKRVSGELKDTVLFYGGGIQGEKEAREMAAYADVIVVGNIIYDDLKEALKTVLN